MSVDAIQNYGQRCRTREDKGSSARQQCESTMEAQRVQPHFLLVMTAGMVGNSANRAEHAIPQAITVASGRCTPEPRLVATDARNPVAKEAGISVDALA